MTTATIFHGLYQGEYDSEEDATLVAVFSTEDKATAFGDSLSKQHTELKREANNRRAAGLETEDIPNLYWDARPVAFDPRETGELL
jgi:hypothetical protein